MRYLKLFESYDSILDLIDTILLPITDGGYKFNVNIEDNSKQKILGVNLSHLEPKNTQKLLEIYIYVEGEDSFTEKSNIIIGSEIKESVLTLLDFLKRRTGNEPSVYVWDDSDYTYIDLKDIQIHGLEDLDDLREEYAETDSMKIVVLLDS
jgi:hypothetical protein